MLVTTCLMPLVMILCWNRSAFIAIAFVLFFGSIEALYFSSALIKFLEGAWVPIVLSFVFLIIMSVWHYGTLKKYEFDEENKVSLNWLLRAGPDLGIVRVPGIGLIHTELVSGIPAILSHFVANLPAFHRVLVFFCIKHVPMPHVQPEERFLVGRVGPKEHRVYRCIARYGYRDALLDDVAFEEDLICSIAEFIQSGREHHNYSDDGFADEEKMAVVGAPSSAFAKCVEIWDDGGSIKKCMEVPTKRVRFVVPEVEEEGELEELAEARETGMAFILGHCHVKAKAGSSMMKRIAIDVGYDFLRRNSRAPTYIKSFPHASTLEVGMIYHV